MSAKLVAKTSETQAKPKPGSAPVSLKSVNSVYSRIVKASPPEVKKSDRKPLYEPKYRVKLPPRVTRKVKRWPTIKIPPLKLKKWRPDKVPKRAPKPQIVLPPLKTRPWKPISIKKQPPKPKIDYPPVKLRRTPWKPDHKQTVHKKVPIRLSYTFYVAKISTLGKNWHQFKQMGPKCLLLRGNYSQTCKKFNFISNDKQSAAIAIVAIGYANIWSMSLWTRSICDSVLDTGDALYKATLSKRRSKVSELCRPNKIYPSFFVEFIKVSVDTSNEVMVGDFNNSDKDSIEKLVSIVTEIIDNYDACILSYGTSNYAIWRSESSFYCFNPYDCDDHGCPVAKFTGKCCVVRMPSIALVVEYVALVLTPDVGKYEVFSFRIVGLTRVSKIPPETTAEKTLRKVKSENAIEKLVRTTAIPEREVFRPVSAAPPPAAEKPVAPDNRLKDIIANTHPSDFSKDYMHTAATQPRRGILRGMQYLAESIRAPCLNVAAISMLRMSKSNAWITSTIEEIFDVGNAIYEENISIVDGEEVLATEINTVIKVGKKSFEVDAEHFVYGKLNSKSIDVVGLETGLRKFFDKYDTGVLQGPQSVAVWHEMSFYYMFDPKERDANGHKWHKGSPNMKDGRDGGVACVLFFENLKQLCECYMTNVPTKYKYDPFKITKVEIKNYIPKAENYKHWRGLTMNKWILRGVLTQDAQIFGRSSKNNQATGIAAIALAYKNIYDMLDWSYETVDAVIQGGDDFYLGSVANLKNENKYKHPHLTVNELLRFFVVDEQNVQFDIDECCINGSLLALCDDEQLDLRQAFKQFFMQNENGIITSCDCSYAFWRDKSVFYVFDSYPRDALGRNVRTCSADKMLVSDLRSCVMRFNKLSDMVHHIASNFQIMDSPLFNISKVNVQTLKVGDRPPLYCYKPLLHYKFAAILRPFYGMHEDHLNFGIRGIEKTMFNLITCLAMTHIIEPEKWKQNEINNILRIGSKWYLKTASKMEKNEKLTWTHFEKDIQIGTTIFSCQHEEERCSFLPRVGFREEEELWDKIIINQLPAESKLQRMSTTSMPSTQSGASASVQPQSSEVLYPNHSLPTLIESWSKDMEKDTILESDIFKLAIWKRNTMYFVFDPRSAKEDGSLTIQRLVQMEHTILERVKVRCIKSLADGASTISIKSGLIELTEGTVKEFDLPGPTPSIRDLNEFIQKETYAQIRNKLKKEDFGSAYVAWFTAPDLLVDYIWRKLPFGYCYEDFTLHTITFQAQKKESKTNNLAVEETGWKAFQNVGKGRWIIRGTLFQGDSLFQKENRNYQDAANCVACLAIISECPAEDWNPFMVDAILKYGDRLYTKSVNEMRLMSINHTSPKIPLKCVVPSFTIDNINNMVMKARPLVYGDITAADDNKETMNLTQAFQKYFEPSTFYYILESKDTFVSLWKYQSFLFMFAPYRLGPDGKLRPIGVSCIERFEKQEDLARAYLLKLDYTFGSNRFVLYDVKFTKSVIAGGTTNLCETDSEETLEDVPPKMRTVLPRLYTPFQVLRSGARAIFGDTAENYAVYGCDAASNRTPPSACHAVAAVAVMKCQYVEFWTAKTIDEILVLGMKLYEQSRKASGSPTISNPQDVVRSFNMNAIFITVVMALFSKGHVQSKGAGDDSLKSGFFKFFELHTSGILSVANLVLAFWKSCGLFYMFYPMPMNSVGTIFDGGRACLISFNTLEMLLDSIVSNIHIPDVSVKDADYYEIRQCDIVCSVAEADEVKS